MRNKIIIWFLIIVLLLFLAVCILKPSVHDASVEELQEINGIGELLSDKIVIYLDHNPYADIDDITDVKGIGELKLKSIKRRFKW